MRFVNRFFKNRKFFSLAAPPPPTKTVAEQLGSILHALGGKNIVKRSHSNASLAQQIAVFFKHALSRIQHFLAQHATPQGAALPHLAMIPGAARRTMADSTQITHTLILSPLTKRAFSYIITEYVSFVVNCKEVSA
jgi:hypothetical protein